MDSKEFRSVMTELMMEMQQIRVKMEQAAVKFSDRQYGDRLFAAAEDCMKERISAGGVDFEPDDFLEAIDTLEG